MSGQSFNKVTTAKASVILHKKKYGVLFRLTFFRGKYQVIAYGITPLPQSRSFATLKQAMAFYRLVQLPKNIKKVSLWSIS